MLSATKSTFLVLTSMLVALAARGSNADVISPTEADALYSEAAGLYRNGNAKTATKRYRRIIASGYSSAEVMYNLGLASMKANDPGSAVLNFRRAWRLKPRDPDVNAAMTIAVKRAGAPQLTPHSAVIRLLHTLSVTEWIILSQVLYWACALAAAMRLLLRKRGKAFSYVVALLSIPLALSLAGIWAWRTPDRLREGVVMTAADVRLAPRSAAISHFPLPAGSLVRVLEASGEWAKVSVGSRSGWIPRTTVVPIVNSQP